jgi:hypothetical protein
MKVIMRDYSSASSKNTEATVDGDTLLLDRLAYRVLGSRTDNRTLTTPTTIGGDVDRLLLDLNELYSTNTPDPELVALDQYLGELGVTLTYPFVSEVYDSPAWLSSQSQDPYRYVVDRTNNIVDLGLQVVHKTGV